MIDRLGYYYDSLKLRRTEVCIFHYSFNGHHMSKSSFLSIIGIKYLRYISKRLLRHNKQLLMKRRRSYFFFDRICIHNLVNASKFLVFHSSKYGSQVSKQRSVIVRIIPEPCYGILSKQVIVVRPTETSNIRSTHS